MANGGLIARAVLAAAIAAPAAAAGAQCRLCPDAEAAAQPKASPVTISIDTGIDFSRIGLAAAGQGGNVVIDPATGRRIVGPGLIDLSGIPVQGQVVVRGARNEHVVVTLPTEVVLTNASGGTIRLGAITTTLKPNPKLDKDGLLRFSFGGRLELDGRSDGDFRGRIPITVDYR